MKKSIDKFTPQESEHMYRLLKDVYETLLDQQAQETRLYKPKLYEKIWLVGIQSFIKMLENK